MQITLTALGEACILIHTLYQSFTVVMSKKAVDGKILFYEEETAWYENRNVQQTKFVLFNKPTFMSKCQPKICHFAHKNTLQNKMCDHMKLVLRLASIQIDENNNIYMYMSTKSCEAKQWILS